MVILYDCNSCFFIFYKYLYVFMFYFLGISWKLFVVRDDLLEKEIIIMYKNGKI